MNTLEIGTSAQFAAIQGFLADAGYWEPRICEKLGLASPDALDIVTLSESLKERVARPEPLNTLLRLFLLGEFIPISEAETQFSGAISRGRPFHRLRPLVQPRSHTKTIFSRYRLPGTHQKHARVSAFLARRRARKFSRAVRWERDCRPGCLANRPACLGNRHHRALHAIC